jgi:uncharacterized protein YjbJ (UPF0337 family)
VHGEAVLTVANSKSFIRWAVGDPEKELTMSEPTLNQLEREVEMARARLASNLGTLRSPATYSEFQDDLKVEAIHTKDALVQKVRATTQSIADALLADVKARAAANPVAALLIGAGFAWRFIRHPPVATALVGAGLFSLFRTAPAPYTGFGEPDYLAQAKDNLSGQINAAAGDAKQRLGDVAATLSQQVSDLGRVASDNFQEKSADMRDAVRRMAGNATEAAQSGADHSYTKFEEIASRSAAAATEMSSVLQTALSQQDVRDKVLLGAAGLAVAAALGIAYERRNSEMAEESD